MIFSAFLSVNFKPARRKPSHFPTPARLISDVGTKVAPLIESRNRGSVVYYLFLMEVSQLHALSLQKV
jgi:hypothetical protein